MRLIDADVLKKAMDGYWGRCQRIRKPRNGETAVFLDVMATVENQPTVDAVPVRHGKWIHRGCGVFTCDKCSRDIGLNVYTTEKASERFKYCPNCGARMDAE